MRFLVSLMVRLFSPKMPTSVLTQAVAKDFVPDPNIQRLAAAYARDAVDFAIILNNIKLDWSDGSIAQADTILTGLHESYVAATPQPTEEKVTMFAKTFGSYVGEVHRCGYGSTWGRIIVSGHAFTVMLSASGSLIWPWSRAHSQIVHGPKFSILEYYRPFTEGNSPR